MEKITINVDAALPRLNLGQQGEHLARCIIINPGAWTAEYGPGSLQMVVQPSGADAPYPVALQPDGDLYRWDITDADTALAGAGEAQLVYIVDGRKVKSARMSTYVGASLGSTADPPDRYKGYVDKVVQLAASAENAAKQTQQDKAGMAQDAEATAAAAAQVKQDAAAAASCAKQTEQDAAATKQDAQQVERTTADFVDTATAMEKDLAAQKVAAIRSINAAAQTGHDKVTQAGSDALTRIQAADQSGDFVKKAALADLMMDMGVVTPYADADGALYVDGTESIYIVG